MNKQRIKKLAEWAKSLEGQKFIIRWNEEAKKLRKELEERMYVPDEVMRKKINYRT